MVGASTALAEVVPMTGVTTKCPQCNVPIVLVVIAVLVVMTVIVVLECSYAYVLHSMTSCSCTVYCTLKWDENGMGKSM